jgi:hypothetical protein
MAKVRVFVDLPQSSAQLQQSLANDGLRYEQLQSMQFLLAELSAGIAEGRVNVQVGDAGGASSVGKFTFSSSGASSISINGEALVGGTDYVIENLSASEVALNAAEAIRNSQSSKIQAVMAEASGADVNLVAKEAGEVGDLITTTATGAAAADTATLEDGEEPEQQIYLFNRKA